MNIKHQMSFDGILSAIVAVAALGPFPIFAAAQNKLPDGVEKPGYVDKIPAPGGERQMFYIFSPPEQGVFGVASPDGDILWRKTTGLRSLVDYFWAADGKSVVFVTDCTQDDADIRSSAASASPTRSYFYVFEATSGTVLAEGDLDTDVFDLPKRCPDAMGASHELTIVLKDGIISGALNHRGTIIAGSRALAELPPKVIPTPPGHAEQCVRGRDSSEPVHPATKRESKASPATRIPDQE